VQIVKINTFNPALSGKNSARIAQLYTHLQNYAVDQ
jgi:hypothetical protein